MSDAATAVLTQKRRWIDINEFDDYDDGTQVSMMHHTNSRAE